MISIAHPRSRLNPASPLSSRSPIVGGRYELRDLIGRGGSGTVYEVYDRTLGRVAALKTMPIGPRDAAAVAGLRLFHTTARAVARLFHPNIVSVHDFGETADFRLGRDGPGGR